MRSEILEMGDDWGDTIKKMTVCPYNGERETLVIVFETSSRVGRYCFAKGENCLFFAKGENCPFFEEEIMRRDLEEYLQAESYIRDEGVLIMVKMLQRYYEEIKRRLDRYSSRNVNDVAERENILEELRDFYAWVFDTFNEIDYDS